MEREQRGDLGKRRDMENREGEGEKREENNL